MPAKERVKKLIWPAATPLCWSEKNPGQPETTAKLRWRPAFTTEKNRIFGPIFRVPILSQARKRASRGHTRRHPSRDSWIPAFAQGCPENDSLCRKCTPSAAAFLGLLSGCRDTERRAWRALSKYGSRRDPESGSSPCVWIHRVAASGRQIWERLPLLGPSRDAAVRPTGRGFEPPRAGLAVERPSAPPLPSGQRAGLSLDRFGCQSTPSERDLRGALRAFDRPGVTIAAPRWQAGAAPDRRDPDPADQSARMGELERTNAWAEGACGLRSKRRPAGPPGDHVFDSQRRDDCARPLDRARRDLRLRQGLCRLSLVAPPARRQLHLHHSTQDQRPIHRHKETPPQQERPRRLDLQRRHRPLGFAAENLFAHKLAPNRAAPRRRPCPLHPHKRSQTLRRQNSRSLSKALADRAVVPMDQTASQNPRLLRPIGKRRPPAALRSPDRLPAAAHRRCRKPIQNFGPPLRRSRPFPALRALPNRPHRQATAATIPLHKAVAQPNGLRLCLIFTGQPCAQAGIQESRDGCRRVWPWMPAFERVKKLIWPAATPLCWSEKNPGQPETTAKLRWRPAFTTEKNRIFGPIFRVPILSQTLARA